MEAVRVAIVRIARCFDAKRVIDTPANESHTVYSKNIIESAQIYMLVYTALLKAKRKFINQIIIVIAIMRTALQSRYA